MTAGVAVSRRDVERIPGESQSRRRDEAPVQVLRRQLLTPGDSGRRDAQSLTCLVGRGGGGCPCETPAGGCDRGTEPVCGGLSLDRARLNLLVGTDWATSFMPCWRWPLDCCRERVLHSKGGPGGRRWFRIQNGGPGADTRRNRQMEMRRERGLFACRERGDKSTKGAGEGNKERSTSTAVSSGLSGRQAARLGGFSVVVALGDGWLVVKVAFNGTVSRAREGVKSSQRRTRTGRSQEVKYRSTGGSVRATESRRLAGARRRGRETKIWGGGRGAIERCSDPRPTRRLLLVFALLSQVLCVPPSGAAANPCRPP